MSSTQNTCDGSQAALPEAFSSNDRPPALPAGESTVELRSDRLTAEKLAETHPNLPDGWSRSMGYIRRVGGPWDCECCGGPSYLLYRCSKCGYDLCES